METLDRVTFGGKLLIGCIGSSHGAIRSGVDVPIVRVPSTSKLENSPTTATGRHGTTRFPPDAGFGDIQVGEGGLMS